MSDDYKSIDWKLYDKIMDMPDEQICGPNKPLNCLVADLSLYAYEFIDCNGNTRLSNFAAFTDTISCPLFLWDTESGAKARLSVYLQELSKPKVWKENGKFFKRTPKGVLGPFNSYKCED